MVTTYEYFPPKKFICSSFQCGALLQNRPLGAKPVSDDEHHSDIFPAVVGIFEVISCSFRRTGIRETNIFPSVFSGVADVEVYPLSAVALIAWILCTPYFIHQLPATSFISLDKCFGAVTLFAIWFKLELIRPNSVLSSRMPVINIIHISI